MKTQEAKSFTTSGFHFNYAFKFERDFNPENFIPWFTRNWTGSIALSAIYVIIIFSIKHYMRQRPKYNLRYALAVWSGILAVYSIVSSVRLLSEAAYVLFTHGWDYSICYPTVFYGDTAVWMFLFGVSKAYELGDTLFIVLRKQPLIFLHWYHHITVLIYAWYTYAYYHAPGRWYAAINCGVHSIMYTYYCLKALRVWLPRWVNILITSIQILQMVFGIYVNVSVKRILDSGEFCHVTYGNIIYSSIIYSTYFILFGNFFYNAYVKPKDNASKTLKVKSSISNGITGENAFSKMHNGNVHQNGDMLTSKKDKRV